MRGIITQGLLGGGNQLQGLGLLQDRLPGWKLGFGAIGILTGLRLFVLVVVEFVLDQFVIDSGSHQHGFLSRPKLTPPSQSLDTPAPAR